MAAASLVGRVSGDGAAGDDLTPIALRGGFASLFADDFDVGCIWASSNLRVAQTPTERIDRVSSPAVTVAVALVGIGVVVLEATISRGWPFSSPVEVAAPGREVPVSLLESGSFLGALGLISTAMSDCAVTDSVFDVSGSASDVTEFASSLLVDSSATRS